MSYTDSSTSTARAVVIVNDKGIIRIILHLELGRNINEILRSVMPTSRG